MNKYLTLILVLLMSCTTIANPQISNLIMPVSYFVNHVKQLNELRDNLLQYRKSSIVAISGMGKTQTSRMYAYEHRDDYQIIWFIDCNLDLNEEFVKLAKAINRQEKNNSISEDAEEAKKDVMSYLASKNKWLLVLDNLKVQENEKIREFIDWEHNGHIIFGSQDGESLPNIVKMVAFEKNDTLALASNILKDKNSNFAEFLSEEFVGYPILVVQGAQLLNQVPGLEKQEYSKKIKQSIDKIKLNITLAMKELKPSARELLNKISLINNQAFSKNLLEIITDNKNNLDDDIYQLSKFALIANIDLDQVNPVFEMHDVITQKIQEINGNKKNKDYLEDIISKFMNSIPKSVVKAHVFEEAKTIRENLEIIAANTQKYHINIYQLMELNLQLIIRYVNFLDVYNSQKLINWFNKNDKEGKFKLYLMNNDERGKYACYLGLIGTYYVNSSDYHIAIDYFTRAKEVFHNVKGYGAFKCNIFYFLAISNIQLGKIREVEKNIKIMQQMFADGLVDKNNINYVYASRARLLLLRGKYLEALEQIKKTIKIFIKNLGLKPDDLFLTSSYLLKADILNTLNQYQEAFIQANQVYDMHKSVTKLDNEVFGRIYTQMSKSKLGLGKSNIALEYVTKAKDIFINDKLRNNKNLKTSKDTNLATALVAEGDILSALGKIEEAITAYQCAETIYNNCLEQNLKIDSVSLLYFKVASAALKINDEFTCKHYLYKHEQVFSIDHPRTKELYKLLLTPT